MDWNEMDEYRTDYEHFEYLRKERDALRAEVERLHKELKHTNKATERQAHIQAQQAFDNMNCRKDAERYRWLRSRKGLCLRSCCSEWMRVDGTKFTASHYLAEGDTQHAAAPTLDETIDAAMGGE